MRHASVSERALVLAPLGRDAVVAAAMLGEAGVAVATSPTLSALVAALDDGAGCVLITEEALDDADLRPLAAWLAGQEEWSDLPFILLTRRGGGLERNPGAARHLDVLGNVTFLERPFHPTTLVSLARSALRGRRRQYEARARLIELRELNESLERRIQAAVAARQAADEQRHEAQKLETIGQLTGGVAHDMNNLLTPITGALDLLQRRMGDQDPRMARLIDGALQSAERARLLVSRLLGFARRQSLETRPTDICALVAGIRDLIASSIGPTIALELDCPPDLPSAVADPNQLELAILNLSVNARDAMPDGGRLTIHVSHETIAATRSRRLAAGEYVRVVVSDTGSGMDATTLARAIEPFYSTKDTGKGTGLGLSMVHGLAAQLGGAFSLESRLGEGTQAILRLPVAHAAPAARRTMSVDIAAPDRPLSILLVDDEDFVRTSTAEMLRELGHQVEAVATGAQALQRLEAGATFDLLVSDYMMPGIRGSELAARAERIAPTMPILIISGYAGGDLDVPWLQLAKPFRPPDLAAAISRLTMNNRPSNPPDAAP